MQEIDSAPASPSRIRPIDQFRGFAIILMVVFNYFSGIETLPDWLKHVPDLGMNFPDLGTPVFIFAIGLVYGLSFQRRQEKYGFTAARVYFIRRYLALIGLGAIITAGQTVLGRELDRFDWGVLQSIGASGLVTLLVIQMKTRTRAAVGLGILTLFQILVDRAWLGIVLSSQHGGLPGTLSWSAILILSTVMADIFHDLLKRKYFPWISLLILLSGLTLAILIPVSKNRLNASYDLITLGFAGVVFSIFYLCDFRLPYFEAWGRNPLLLYLLSFLVTGLFALPGNPYWYTQAPLWLIAVQGLFIVSVLSFFALYWQRKGFRFSM